MLATKQIINENGLAQIAAFLTKNTHLAPTLDGDRDCLKAWAGDAEYEMSQGRAPVIEINSMVSANQRRQLLTVSADGISSEALTQ